MARMYFVKWLLQSHFVSSLPKVIWNAGLCRSLCRYDRRTGKSEQRSTFQGVGPPVWIPERSLPWWTCKRMVVHWNACRGFPVVEHGQEISAFWLKHKRRLRTARRTGSKMICFLLAKNVRVATQVLGRGQCFGERSGEGSECTGGGFHKVIVSSWGWLVVKLGVQCLHYSVECCSRINNPTAKFCGSAEDRHTDVCFCYHRVRRELSRSTCSTQLCAQQEVGTVRTCQLGTYRWPLLPSYWSHHSPPRQGPNLWIRKCHFRKEAPGPRGDLNMRVANSVCSFSLLIQAGFSFAQNIKPTLHWTLKWTNNPLIPAT